MAARLPVVARAAAGQDASARPSRPMPGRERASGPDRHTLPAASTLPARLPRHTLVWPHADADWHVLTPGADARLRAWFAAGHPAIVARGDGSDPAGMLRLGVPLPPAEHKQRLSLRLAPGQLCRHQPPPTLGAVLGDAPPCWRSALDDLMQVAATLGIAPRVFGSFAWQALTSLDYVHDGSDLDLLWPVAAPEQADAVVKLLQRWEAHHGHRADGELLLPDAGAVNWREYAGGERKVLVKGEHACRMRPRTALFPVGGAA